MGRQYKPIEGFNSLTKREHEVLRLVAKGYDNHEIAQELFISPNYVRHLMKQVYFKTGFHGDSPAKRIKLIFYAMKVLKEQP